MHLQNSYLSCTPSETSCCFDHHIQELSVNIWSPKVDCFIVLMTCILFDLSLLILCIERSHRAASHWDAQVQEREREDQIHK